MTSRCHPVQRSKRFPRAIFYCHLCHRHFDDNWYVEKHLEQEQHQLRLSVSEMRMDVKNIPHPVKVQVKAIDSLLQSVSGFGLTKEKVELRKAFAEKLEASLRETLPDIKLTLHGSSVNGFGLYDSEVNLDLSSTGKTEVAELLVELSDKITQDEDNFSSPERDFLAKVPRFRFVDGPTDLKCEISLNNSNSIKTSRLLADYASLDPRVQSLGVIFRYWGHVCKLDRQERGTLPPHAYPIMVIYFLQQCKPPVVPRLGPPPVLEGLGELPSFVLMRNCLLTELLLLMLHVQEWKWKSTNNRSLGDLWCELLRFYAAEFRLEKHVVCIRRLKPVLISEKKWNKRYIAIEDPYSSKRNLARSIPSEEMNLFLKRALRESAIYFHEPQVTGAIDLIRPNVYAQPRCTDNSEFGSDSDSDQEESKVNPSLLYHSGLALTLDDEGNSEHGSKTPSAKPHKRKEASTTAGASEFVRPGPPMTQQNIDKLSRLSKEDFDYQFTLETLSNGRVRKVKGWGRTKREIADGKLPAKDTYSFFFLVQFFKFCTPDSSFQLGENLGMQSRYRFFSLLQEPPMICTFCMKKGHLQENCPDQILPQLVELPPMTRGHIMILNDVCLDVMRECSPRPHEEKDRNMLLHELESLIRELYSDARLTLYGSSCNGFGLARSDLDICLTFDSSKDGKELCHSKMIPELAKKLRAHPDLDRIVPITTAKVPIVKFYHRPSRLEGDISLYNTLAQHNTRLLKVYSDIDKRVRVLGYTLKHFAKTCDIGDASRGSLSSYAYILMVLYYLQHKRESLKAQLDFVSSARLRSCRDLKNIFSVMTRICLQQSVWSEFGQNNESVGELWLGLLRFYTEVFDFRADVVCIRQRKRITRLQKSWTSRCIAIEDPFELDHNLGSGVSRKSEELVRVITDLCCTECLYSEGPCPHCHFCRDFSVNAFIMKALIKGRALFGTPFRKPPAAYDSYIGYFFDRRQLVDGQPPNDRGCRLCSKIGHRVKDCPRRRGANNNGSQNDRVQGGGSLLERSRDFASGRGRAPQDNWRQPQDGAYQR
ncbi:zinc finger protein, putative [Ixodes scapularis]|uniref:Zinc finger protein, putative n=1 Tax=Ixodes scapularis TaxID=6945 RepID=B7PQC9_IXOSC|nr:zinc finger protein, putative [Ixodes scapularis]|eukprot:XP_002435971.1 zinc finger protein, putative [Ixodes scapularis]